MNAWRRRSAATCYGGYGLTETGPILAAAIPKTGIEYSSEEERYRRQSMTGWPLIGNQVRVVDTDMRDVPHDMAAIGEIVVRGDHVMDGYWNDAGGHRGSNGRRLAAHGRHGRLG